jgi:hypothetical protein
MLSARTRRLKAEALARISQSADSFDQQPSGGDLGTCRIERRKPTRDLVCVHKLDDAQFRRDDAWHGGRFSSAIRAAEDNNVLHRASLKIERPAGEG